MPAVSAVKTTPLRVLICGAGISGPALAFWLIRQGHSCTIIERFPSLRANGQQIDIREQGVDVVRRMGLIEEIRKHVVQELGLQVVDTHGAQKALFPKIEADAAGRQSFTSEYEVMRGTLCRMLYDLTKEEATYRFGLSVEDFANLEDGVRVTLSDGSVETYDLLVGADGQGSRIRKMLLQRQGADMQQDDGKLAAQSCQRDLRLWVAYCTLPRTPDDPSLATCYNATDQRIIMTRWHNETQGQGYFMTMAHADEFEQVMKQSVPEQKALFARVFRDAGWECERLVRDMLAADDLYAHSQVQIRSPTWSKGRVALIGDAGYCPTPLTGMGTSLAFLGAFVLAGEIATHKESLEEALAAYDTTLRPLVDHVQKLPPGIPSALYLKSAWGIKLMQWALGLTTMLKLDKAVQLLMMWKSEQWKLPAYPDLKGQHVEQ